MYETTIILVLFVFFITVIVFMLRISIPIINTTRETSSLEISVSALKKTADMISTVYNYVTTNKVKTPNYYAITDDLYFGGGITSFVCAYDISGANSFLAIRYIPSTSEEGKGAPHEFYTVVPANSPSLEVYVNGNPIKNFCSNDTALYSVTFTEIRMRTVFIKGYLSEDETKFYLVIQIS